MEKENPKLSFELRDDDSDDAEDSPRPASQAREVGHVAARRPIAERLSVSKKDTLSDRPKHLIDSMLAKAKQPETPLPVADKESEEVAANQAPEDIETVDEAEAPLERLSSAEELVAAQDFSEERSEVLEAVSDDDEETAVVRDAALLMEANLQELLAQPETAEKELDELLETAAQQTLEELQPSPTTEEVEVAEGVESESESEVPDVDEAQEVPDDEPIRVSAQPQPKPKPQPKPAVGGNSGKGGGSQPPGSNPSSSSGWSFPRRRGSSIAPPPPPGSYTAPAVKSPAVAPTTMPEMINANDARYNERRALQRGLLVGGIVGYLIGRRRGRIKTERRLQAVQHNLEKQVVEVQRQVAEKELQVQQFAREQYRQTHPVELASSASKQESISAVIPPAERPIKPAFQRRPEWSAPPTLERLPPTRPEKLPQPEIHQQRPGTPKSIEQFNRTELIELSQTIRFGETNLKRVYESRLVNEAGLRRLVREYYAGHDLRRALAREFLAKEMRFERDPRLRDLLPEEVHPRSAAGAPAATVAAAAPTATAMSPSPKPAASLQQQSKQAAPAPTKPKTSPISPMIIVGLFVVTIALALYAIWLTITR
jgi:hypothetical protein